MSDADLELRERAIALSSMILGLPDARTDFIVEALQAERSLERQRCAAIARHFGALTFGGTPLTVKETAERIASLIEDSGYDGSGGME